MAHFRRFWVILILVGLVLGCEPDDPPVLTIYTDQAGPLAGIWRYDSVMIKNVNFLNADNRMIPGGSIAQMGGLRSQLDRRMIQYLPNGSYQLGWDDRGEYQLGVEDTESWQPDFGFWSMDYSSMTLTHNNSLTYQTDYEILLLDENHLARKYLRKMSQSSNEYGPSGLWLENEYVEYYEYFTRE